MSWNDGLTYLTTNDSNSDGPLLFITHDNIHDSIAPRVSTTQTTTPNLLEWPDRPWPWPWLQNTDQLMTSPPTLTRKLNRLSLPIVQGSCYASVAKSLAFPVGLPTCCPLVMVLPNSINLRYNHAFQGISQPSQVVTTIVVYGYWWSKVYRSQQKMLYKDAKFILKPKELKNIHELSMDLTVTLPTYSPRIWGSWHT